MSLEMFRQLCTPAGQAALAEAASLAPTEPMFLQCFETLHKQHPPELAKAALEKFIHADRMFFTRQALEQASSEVVARHRANRFVSFGQMADLCCGIGGDALTLAAAGVKVEAVDSDPLRIAIAEANAAALDVGDRVRCHIGDAVTLPLPED